MESMQGLTQNAGYSQIVTGPTSVTRMNQNNVVSLYLTPTSAKIFQQVISLCGKIGKEVGILVEGSNEGCRVMLIAISEDDTSCFRVELDGEFFDVTSRFPVCFGSYLKIQPIVRALNDILKRNLTDMSICINEGSEWCQFSQSYGKIQKLTSFRFIDNGRSEVQEPLQNSIESGKSFTVMAARILKVVDQVQSAATKVDEIVVDVMSSNQEIKFRNGTSAANDTAVGSFSATLKFNRLQKVELQDENFTVTLGLKSFREFTKFCQTIGGGPNGIGQMSWHFSDDSGGPCLIKCATPNIPNPPQGYDPHIDTYLVQTTAPKEGVGAPPPKPRTQASQKTQNAQQPKIKKIRRTKTAPEPPPPSADDFANLPDIPMPSQAATKRVRFSVTQNSPAAANNGEEVTGRRSSLTRSQTAGAPSQAKSPMQEIPQDDPFAFPPTPGQNFTTQRFSVSRGNAVRNSIASTQNQSRTQSRASVGPVSAQVSQVGGTMPTQGQQGIHVDAAAEGCESAKPVLSQSQQEKEEEDDGLTEEQRQEQRERELAAQKRADEIRIGSLPSFDVNVPDLDMVLPPSPEIHGSQPAKPNVPSMLYNFAPTPEGTEGVKFFNFQFAFCFCV